MAYCKRHGESKTRLGTRHPWECCIGPDAPVPNPARLSSHSSCTKQAQVWIMLQLVSSHMKWNWANNRPNLEWLGIPTFCKNYLWASGSGATCSNAACEKPSWQQTIKLMTSGTWSLWFEKQHAKHNWNTRRTCLVSGSTLKVCCPAQPLSAFLKHAQHTGESNRGSWLICRWKAPTALPQTKTLKYPGSVKWIVFSFACCHRWKPSGGCGGAKVLFSSWSSGMSPEDDPESDVLPEESDSSSWPHCSSSDDKTTSALTVSFWGSGTTPGDSTTLPLLVLSGLNFPLAMSSINCSSRRRLAAAPSLEYTIAMCIWDAW